MYTKAKGENVPYCKIKLSEIVDEKELPEYDFTKKWNTKKDRPPRRRIDYTMNAAANPATRKEARKPVHPLSRENSGRTMSKLHRRIPDNAENMDTSKNTSNTTDADTTL